MSLYNMINGVNQATFFILPMLGKHPDDYPRFRDCFSRYDIYPEYTNHIFVYTRVGGGNREDYEEQINVLRNNENYVSDFDDDYDSTFATFIFKVPDIWKDDYNKIMSGDLMNISNEYFKQIKIIFPKLSEQFDIIFSKTK